MAESISGFFFSKVLKGLTRALMAESISGLLISEVNINHWQNSKAGSDLLSTIYR